MSGRLRSARGELETHPAAPSSTPANHCGCSRQSRRRATARRTGASRARLRQSALLGRREPLGRPPCGSRRRAEGNAHEQQPHKRGPRKRVRLRCVSYKLQGPSPSRSHCGPLHLYVGHARTHARSLAGTTFTCVRASRGPPRAWCLRRCKEQLAQAQRSVAAQACTAAVRSPWHACAARVCLLLAKAARARPACELPSSAAVSTAAMATPSSLDGLNGAVKAYIRRMLAECGSGMKALVLDATTVRSAAAQAAPWQQPSSALFAGTQAHGGRRLRGCAGADRSLWHKDSRGAHCPPPDGYRQCGVLAVGDSSKRGAPCGRHARSVHPISRYAVVARCFHALCDPMRCSRCFWLSDWTRLLASR